LSYSSSIAYGDTMSQCFATGADSEWTGVKTIKPTATTLSLKPTAGTYVYTITCGGMQSASTTLTVTGSTKTATTTAITATPASLPVGNTVTLSAKVTGTSGTPTGTVSFYYGSTLLHTSTLSDGTGTFAASTTGLPAGTYGISATYSGDAANDGSSTTKNANVTLTNNTTSTALTVTPNPIAAGGTATLVAIVARTNQGATGIPGGTVNFYVDTTLLNPTPIKVNSQGHATFSASTNGIGAGTYPVHAQYSGDNGDAASTSNTVMVVLN
jgi:Bacterial Ig-like domain (group 3)